MRVTWLAIVLLAVAAPGAAAQVQKVQVRGWDPAVSRPVVARLSGEAATATVSGRLLAHEAAHTVQQRGGASAPGVAQVAENHNSSRSNVALIFGGGAGRLDLEVAEDVPAMPQDGDPIPEIDVRLIRIPDGPVLTATTDADGDFRFEGVPPGDYELRWTVHGASLVQPITIGSAVAVKEEGVD